jgi:hypothetical protein
VFKGFLKIVKNSSCQFQAIGYFLRVSQPRHKMKKSLSHFRHMDRLTIAKLDGMKSIMRVEKPRQVSWWLVLPAIGDSDSPCVLLDKAPWSTAARHQKTLLSEYADRIVKA